MSDFLFGIRLKQYRTNNHLSQQELADIIGTSKQVISRYESSQRSPKISVVAEYAQKLGVDISYFTDSVPAAAAPGSNDPELDKVLQSVYEDPDMRALLLTYDGATPEEIKYAIALVKAKRGLGGDKA